MIQGESSSFWLPPREFFAVATSARLLTSVPQVERERFTALAAERGVSVSHLLARLVHTAIAEIPTARLQRLTAAAANDKAPAEKYTVRLMGADAATLEERAQGRCMTASGYVAHVLRAHLRAEPPMPYKEFQELKVVTNELASIRGALLALVNQRAPHDEVEAPLRENVLRLLPALKHIRDRVQETQIANSKSWEAPGA